MRDTMSEWAMGRERRVGFLNPACPCFLWGIDSGLESGILKAQLEICRSGHALERIDF